MSSYSIVYTTLSTEEEAHSLASYLVENKLAACVNVHAKATSFFMWEGKLQKEGEVVLIAKTRTDMVEKVMVEMKHKHPYDLPALYSFAIHKGDQNYMNWVDQQLL
ncbi:MAG: divalent-cation tolerance protein CutA [Pseudomonadota bacterium]|nr:divalent-cation tolerance protein CutA [Pseudomonadota bacterium]